MTLKSPKRKSSNKDYIKYSSIAYEMAGILIIAVLVGQYIDKSMGNESKWITALLVVLFLGGYFYKLVRDLSNNN